MEAELLELEKSLFNLQFMSDPEYLDRIIDDGYEEIGKSGKRITKQDVISHLSAYKCDRDIQIYNFKCKYLAQDIWLVHYITPHQNELMYRTSIWQRTDGQLRMVFHQASLLKENIELVGF